MNEDRTVLTTGANSGIGLATAIEVARHGFRSVGSVRSEEKAQIVKDAAAEAGVTVDTVLLDVNDADGCRSVVAELEPIYGLVNNAGFGGIGAVEDVDDEQARLVMDTMVLAPARLARLALAGMRQIGGGRIVNVSSIYGVATTPLTGWYQASKHALEALSDALRMEVAADGIKVVLIEPGGFKTGIWDEVERDVERRAESRYADAYRRTLSMTHLTEPLMGSPERVARVIARALQTSAPRARYLVGYDAQAMAMIERLTLTSVKDRVTRLIMGL